MDVSQTDILERHCQLIPQGKSKYSVKHIFLFAKILLLLILPAIYFNFRSCERLLYFRRAEHCGKTVSINSTLRNPLFF